MKTFALLIFAVVLVVVAKAETGNQLSDSQRLNIALEAVTRLDSSSFENNPRLKTVVEKILVRTRGTADFVRITKQLQLKDQDEGLLDVAIKHPAEESGVEAMQMILASDDLALLKQKLQSNDAAKIAEALGNSGKKEAVPLLLPIMEDKERDLALRKRTLKALVQTSEGAREILKWAKNETLPRDLKFIASTELNNVRWEEIKSEAEKLLPLPQSHDSTPLPDVAELLKMKGDPATGEKVFFRADVSCASCHQIKGQGAEIGPALSEIGDKLGKDALLEAILDPSAGISFGYEANQIELKSGDEAYGLVVSETDDEIALKDLKGIVAHYKRGDIARRDQLKTSIMPTGLQQTMTAQELVDLVEFLSTLRKAAD